MLRVLEARAPRETRARPALRALLLVRTTGFPLEAPTAAQPAQVRRRARRTKMEEARQTGLVQRALPVTVEPVRQVRRRDPLWEAEGQAQS